MRERLYTIIEKAAANDKLSRFYDWYIMTVAVASIVPLMFREPNAYINLLETVTVYLLFLDYILRWMTYDYHIKRHSPWAFILYPVTPFAIMDLLGILPSIGLLPSAFMVLRLLRLTKLVHYSASCRRIVNVFREQKKTLLSVLVIAIAYIIISALIMFVQEPADNFPSFFDALYWATTALTTVGYGDVYPHTSVGKLVSMISSLFGVAVIAMPAGIITAGFMDEINKDLAAKEEAKLKKTKREEDGKEGDEKKDEGIEAIVCGGEEADHEQG